MSPEEAVWIGQALASIGEDRLSPLINLGSSTEEYRTRACPQIEMNIFRPLRDRGIAIYHVDLKAERGVDIVGSILDRSVQQVVAALSPGSILCNNLLEHVRERSTLVEVCRGLLRPGGYFVVSVPYKYPYHPDPIDTGFRPSLDELRDVLQGFEFVRGEEVRFGNYSTQLREKRWLLFRDAYLVLKSLWSKDGRRVLLGNYSYLFRQYIEVCAVFRKPLESQSNPR